MSSLPAGEMPQARGVLDDGAGRELRTGLMVILLFFGLFLGWALFARLDVAVYAQGVLGVDGRRQVVQHKDGGVVRAIFVKEGQWVRAGQVLLSLAPAEVEAAERAMSAQVIDLEALIARLTAERAGSPNVSRPAAFADLADEDKDEADRALRLQQSELRTRASSLSSQRAVLMERQTQLSRSITGYNGQVAATDRQSDLIGAELLGAKDLAERGYASTNRVRALERQEALLGGQRADLMASIARSQAQMGETQMQSISLGAERAESVAKDLRDAQYQLNDLLPKLKQLKEQLAATQIRAPVDGQVLGLAVSTVGGVVGPGQHLMEVVPSQSPLVIDAQIPAQDFDGLVIGQAVEIRVASMHERDLPVITGRISKLASDSLSDEKTGRRYYPFEVTVSPAEINKIAKLRGPAGGMRAGLPVQLIIPLRKRTAFEYIVEPISQLIWTSFREH